MIQNSFSASSWNYQERLILWLRIAILRRILRLFTIALIKKGTLFVRVTTSVMDTSDRRRIEAKEKAFVSK
jgi:hypothetical protein